MSSSAAESNLLSSRSSFGGVFYGSGGEGKHLQLQILRTIIDPRAQEAIGLQLVEVLQAAVAAKEQNLAACVLVDSNQSVGSLTSFLTGCCSFVRAFVSFAASSLHSAVSAVHPCSLVSLGRLLALLSALESAGRCR